MRKYDLKFIKNKNGEISKLKLTPYREPTTSLFGCMIFNTSFVDADISIESITCNKRDKSTTVVAGYQAAEIVYFKMCDENGNDLPEKTKTVHKRTSISMFGNKITSVVDKKRVRIIATSEGDSYDLYTGVALGICYELYGSKTKFRNEPKGKLSAEDFALSVMYNLFNDAKTFEDFVDRAAKIVE